MSYCACCFEVKTEDTRLAYPLRNFLIQLSLYSISRKNLKPRKIDRCVLIDPKLNVRAF